MSQAVYSSWSVSVGRESIATAVLFDRKAISIERTKLRSLLDLGFSGNP